MKKILIAVVLTTLAVSSRASKPDFDAAAEEAGFNAATQMFQETGRDKLAVVQAFENFASQFPRSPRIADAEFLMGEAYMQHA
ncbi:MAG: hypothetical protein PHS14_20735, partial [Elusimicrobia bacterium]|nr:hypothetical protein [Elusimicrobiota bacterium]